MYDIRYFIVCILSDLYNADLSKGPNKEISPAGNNTLQPTSMSENNEVNVIVGRDMINLNDCTAPQIRYD